MHDLVVGLVVLAALGGLYKLMLSPGRRPRAGGLTSPTRMLRASSGPFRYSPRPEIQLWGSYALAMVLGVELVFDLTSYSADIAGRHGTVPVSAVLLLVTLACGLCVAMAIPGVIGSPALDLVAAGLAVGLLVVEPSIASLVQTVIALAALALRGTAQWIAVLLSYMVACASDGMGIVILSVVMTVLMGTLTMLIIAMTRDVGRAIAVTIVAVAAAGSALAFAAL